MTTVLIPLPRADFDPTGAAVPWRTLTRAGHEVRFATPDGRPAVCDPRMQQGTGLGPWRGLLRADASGRAAYLEMIGSREFRAPLSYEHCSLDGVHGLLLPGGHAPGMREYLESTTLQALVAHAFERRLIVGAICHGVLLAARARDGGGRSVLHGRRTTALTKPQELLAWGLTAAWLGNYYRTYPTTVEDEVIGCLANPADFLRGPLPLFRDSPNRLARGFTVRDGNYLSARWPGDAHRFAGEFVELLASGPAAG